jgi:hypothetical protein
MESDARSGEAGFHMHAVKPVRINELRELIADA